MSEVKPKDLPQDYLISGVEVLETKLLGEGAYGVVKLGKYFGLLVAVKKLKSSMFPAGIKKLDQQTELILQSFYNECEKLSQIRHPNVVQLLGVFADKHTKLPVIVMEVMYESLSRLLYRTKALPFHIEINMCHDVSQALAYLHSAFRPPIVHRDLSSNNILLSQEHRAKITDLGVAKVAKGSFLRWDDTPAPGTLVYMPPEVRKVPADLTSAMDVFALGVNMIQIRTHKFPKPGPEFTTGRLGFSKLISEKERRKDHLDLMGRLNPLRALAIDCLKDNPRDRPSALHVCTRLEKLKESSEYQESYKLASVKDGEMEEFKAHATELEQRVTDLKEEISKQNSEIERLEAKLEEERSYTARILEDLTRVKLRHEVLLETIKEGPDKKRKNPFSKLKRNRSLREKNGFSHALRDNVEVTASLSSSPVKEQGTPEDNAVMTSMPVLNGKSSREHKKPSSPTKPKRTKRLSPSSTSSSKTSPSATFSDELLSVDKPEGLTGKDRLTWYTHRSLPEGLQGTTLRVHDLGGRLYVCCGEMEDGLPNKGIFYCSINDFTRWKRATPDVPQYQSASAIVQNELVLIGGLSAVNGKCTGAVQSYDSRAQIWVERFPPMPTPRSSASVFVYAEYVVVAGGLDDSNSALNMVEVLHIPSQMWETSARLPIKTAGHSQVVCGDQVYLLGGTDGTDFQQSVFVASVRKIISTCSRFAILANIAESASFALSRSIWSRVQDCPFIKMTAVSKGNQLLAFGGEEVTQSANAVAAEWIWIYNHESNTWTPVQGMPSARKLCCVTVLPDDNLLVIGGDPDYKRIDFAQVV